MDKLLNIQELVSFLKREDLLIVSRKDYEQRINFKEIRFRNQQQELLSKDSLLISEIVKGKLLPVTTRQSVINWINKGKFGEDSVFIGKDGQKRIVTFFVQKLRNELNLL